jgi:hypothetical protein
VKDSSKNGRISSKINSLKLERNKVVEKDLEAQVANLADREESDLENQYASVAKSEASLN